ncbi:SDR family oxidoreductase [Pseudomonas sp. Pseu.R1]|uniref:SDR family oxidoreductase n=1 Tax=Pseudomonas sp. Pseu.R1 TaxID=3379818 RepID=UPI003B92D413
MNRMVALRMHDRSCSAEFERGFIERGDFAEFAQRPLVTKRFTKSSVGSPHSSEKPPASSMAMIWPVARKKPCANCVITCSWNFCLTRCAGKLHALINGRPGVAGIGQRNAAPSIDALYGATKAGVIGLTKANAWNFAPRVRVNAVSPTLVRDTFIHDRTPEHRRKAYERQEIIDDPIEPKGVADVIMFLLSDQSRHLTGKVVPVDNGAYPR